MAAARVKLMISGHRRGHGGRRVNEGTKGGASAPNAVGLMAMKSRLGKPAKRASRVNFSWHRRRIDRYEWRCECNRDNAVVSPLYRDEKWQQMSMARRR